MKICFDIQQSPHPGFGGRKSESGICVYETATQIHFLSNVGIWETSVILDRSLESSYWTHGMWFEDVKYDTIRRFYVDTDIVKQKDEGYEGLSPVLAYLPEAIRMYREQLIEELI